MSDDKWENLLCGDEHEEQLIAQYRRERAMHDIRDPDGVIPSLLIAQHFRKLKLMSEKQPVISCDMTKKIPTEADRRTDDPANTVL